MRFGKGMRVGTLDVTRTRVFMGTVVGLAIRRGVIYPQVNYDEGNYDTFLFDQMYPLDVIPVADTERFARMCEEAETNATKLPATF